MKSQYIFIYHTKVHKYKQFKDFKKFDISSRFKIYIIMNASN